MTVYVDNMNAPLGRLKLSHMVADTLDELHAMADCIGVARRHFQAEASFPHYDICKANRTKAVDAGAVPCTRREMGAIIRRLKAAPAYTAGAGHV